MLTDHPFDDYRGRRVLLMGLGSFGGGIGAVKFLVERGAEVTVTDLRPVEMLSESLNQLSSTPPHRVVAGKHEESDFLTAELIVVNPAVKRDHPLLQAAGAAGIPMTSEMNLFWKWNPAPVVAVTGSNGKSTTTALIYSILKTHLETTRDRTAWLGGNIGSSLLPHVDQIRPTDLVVLELSSFQLADLDRLQASPKVAVVTNFAPNHLDWHADLQHYRWSKQTILRWQTEQDVAVLNADDPEVRQWKTQGIRREFGLRNHGPFGVFSDGRSAILRHDGGESCWPLRDWLKLPGEHNLVNALGAVAATVALGADMTSIRRGIENYEALPHRLQFVAEVAGRQFYNDSLATTPESTQVALQAFDQPVILLAGGYNKHVDLESMARTIAERTKAVSLMGQTGRQLHDLIQSQPQRQCLISAPHLSFSEAFDWAVEHSSPGDIVLLSPGCASYDWFRNFADRGTQFANHAHNYAVRQSPPGT